MDANETKVAIVGMLVGLIVVIALLFLDNTMEKCLKNHTPQECKELTK